MTTYVIIRYGSNSANQPMCQRAVLGTVGIKGRTPRERERQLQARIGASLAGTLHATTTFRQDSTQHWHAYHNQYFRWIAWNKATAGDKAAALLAEECEPSEEVQ